MVFISLNSHKEKVWVIETNKENLKNVIVEFVNSKQHNVTQKKKGSTGYKYMVFPVLHNYEKVKLQGVDWHGSALQ